MYRLFIFVVLLLLVLFSCGKNETPNSFTLRIDSSSVSEAAGEVSIKLSGQGQRNEEVEVQFSTHSNSAQAGEDYLSKTGILIFPKGNETIQQDIIIEILNDDKIEGEEILTISISYVLGQKTTSESIDLTIVDDEMAPSYPGYSTPLEYPGMMLYWQDEFDDEFDSDKWKHATGTGCPNLCGWGNNELEYYREENTGIGNGLLTITAKEENYNNSNYTSSRLLTQDKFTFKYGRVDIRARLPKGKGIWPALWMLGKNYDVVGWAKCGEVDIMELRGSIPSKTCGTVHYENGNGNHQNPPAQCYSIFGGDTFNDEFHVFSIIWDIEKIEWYLDDQKFKEVLFSNLNLGNNENPFHKEFYFLMNLAVGGNYDGNPDETTVFPQKMEVDYIRVFQ